MTLLYLIGAIFLLAGNAFFVGAEFAVISVRRDQMEPYAADGDQRAHVVLTAIENLSLMLAASQLGITICSLGLGAVAEPAIAHLIEGGLDRLGVPDSFYHPIGFAVALLIVVCLHIVLGEMVPKNIALAGPEKAALWLAPPLLRFAGLARPLIVFLNAFANWCVKLVRVHPVDELSTAYTPDQLAAMIAESRQQGLLEDTEHELLTGALELSERTAGTVMMPIAEIVTVPWSVTASELEKLVTRTGFSRFPVRAADGTGHAGPSSDAGNAGVAVPGGVRPSRQSRPGPVDGGTSAGPGTVIVGFVHAKDVIGIHGDARDEPLPPRRLRPMVEVRADLPLDEVLRLMQRTGCHLGRVPGSNGTTRGVVALEDVVEEFVGEVEDASHRIR
ncbi:hemolysin family protein [Candidatus Protofrankia californiensis]|uniref:hemolysin family protein n=1 Tax=Candidatus Protofrankia californiensis TaxID=1839754 RepID=UPI0010416EF2|nr:hemolysin family protein [Candidatus Protofrankia californiensis]